MSSADQDRIATLDIVRGVAVMGILAMNITSFAMPMAAYFNPRAFGTESAADLWSYALSFVLVDGKMRGLFSFLFGASLLLVIQRAPAESAASVTYRRLFWLLVFGCIHFYLVWFGDILIGYALIGMVAYLFRDNPPTKLIGWAVALLALQTLIFAGISVATYSIAAEVAAPNASAQTLRTWEGISRDVGIPTPERLKETLELYRSGWWAITVHQFDEKTVYPFVLALVFGWETLGYMLLGMAAFRSGLLTGAWERGLYVRTALICLAIALPLYLLLLWLLFREDFSVPAIFAWSFAATVPVRPLMVIAYAALIIVLTESSGALVGRIAAAGRMAFTNYLATSVLMTFLFYGWGLGLFGELNRTELWLPVLGMWALMLLWSKPWLERYRYGPLEWAWRSLARGRVEPMRLPAAAGV